MLACTLPIGATCTTYTNCLTCFLNLEQKLKIVKHIIGYRIKNNLTQTDLAKKIGVTQQHISKIENGEFSSMSTLEKVLLSIGYTVKIRAMPLRESIRHRIEQIIHPKRKAQFA